MVEEGGRLIGWCTEDQSMLGYRLGSVFTRALFGPPKDQTTLMEKLIHAEYVWMVEERILD